MASLSCNVVLLPNSELADKAIATSRGLAKEPVLFTLEIGKFFPHVSIYMLQLRRADLLEAVERLKQLADRLQSFELAARKYNQEQGYFDIEYTKTEAIRLLQPKVIELLNPMRDGLMPDDAKRLHNISGLKLENIKLYGFSSVGELYRPHLTLTRFFGRMDISNLPLPNANEFSGEFPAIGIFEMGPNGTCKRKISEFELRYQ
ncbi:MAG: hypothetical protein ABI220_03240 [Candidatus Saccharimonadales bacterium]